MQLLLLVLVHLINTLSLVVIALTAQIQAFLRVVVLQVKIDLNVYALLLINGIIHSMLEVHASAVFQHKLRPHNNLNALIVTVYHTEKIHKLVVTAIAMKTSTGILLL